MQVRAYASCVEESRGISTHSCSRGRKHRTILGAEKSAIGKRKVQQRGRFLQGMMHYWKVGRGEDQGIRRSEDQWIGDARRGRFRFDGLPVLLFRSWDVGSWALGCTLELCMEASSRLLSVLSFLFFSPFGSVPGICGHGIENLTMVHRLGGVL